jgi:4-hydroxybenzoate polyprenyltransferase
MRFDKPTGLVLLGCPACLALTQQNNFFQLKSLIILIGVILTRALGCILNDIADRDIDAQVTRTKERPLAAQTLSIVDAICWATVLAIFSLRLLYYLPQQALPPITIAGLSIIFYPLAKRYFVFPQLILGLSFASSIPVVYGIFERNLSIEGYILFIATLCWVISYDTFYALDDLPEDLHLPIYSLPKTLGEKNSLYLASGLLVLAHLMIIAQLNYSLINTPILMTATLLMLFIIFQATPGKKYYNNLFHLNGLLGTLWCLAAVVSV